MDVVSYGTRRFLAAIRDENPVMVLVGGAILAYGLIKRLEGPRAVKVYSARVKPGQRIEVAVADPGTQRTR